MVVADAEDRLHSPTVMFNIPAQSLITALQAYSAASGVAVLYESGVEIGQYSAPVRGDLTREAALRDAGAAAQAAANPARSEASEQPSIIIVEVVGFSGGSDEQVPENDRRKKDEHASLDTQNYDVRSKFQVIGNGELTEEEKSKLTEEERSRL